MRFVAGSEGVTSWTPALAKLRAICTKWTGSMSPAATPQTRDADDAGKIYSPSLRICWKKVPNRDGTRLGFAPDSPQEGDGFEL
jgi:hypothetical protein